jgi:predicted Zn-dependent peptidase
MVLSAAGRIEHDRMVDLAFKAFGDLPSGAPPKPESAHYAGGDFREDRDLEQMHLVLGFDGVGVHDPDFYAHSVLSTLLGGGMSSRLFQEVREKRGLVYSIYTFTGGYHDGGLFGVYAGTGEDEVAELVPVVCDEVAKVGADVTEDEVARARAQLKAGTLMALESTMSRCEQLGQQMLIYDRPVPVEEIVAKIDGVDRDAVVKAAGRLRASRPTVAALGPIAKLESYDRIAERLA